MTSPRPPWLAHRRWPTLLRLKFSDTIHFYFVPTQNLCLSSSALFSLLSCRRNGYGLGFLRPTVSPVPLICSVSATWIQDICLWLPSSTSWQLQSFTTTCSLDWDHIYPQTSLLQNHLPSVTLSHISICLSTNFQSRTSRKSGPHQCL